MGMGKMGEGRTKEKARGLRRSHADSREMGGGVVGPHETPQPMSCGAREVWTPPVIEETPVPTDGRGWQAAYFGLAFTPRDWWVGLAARQRVPRRL